MFWQWFLVYNGYLVLGLYWLSGSVFTNSLILIHREPTFQIINLGMFYYKNTSQNWAKIWFPGWTLSYDTTCKLNGRRSLLYHAIIDELLEVLELLERAAEVHLQTLSQSGEIPSNSTFQSFTLDVSRFLLKQKEKYLIDKGVDGKKLLKSFNKDVLIVGLYMSCM